MRIHSLFLYERTYELCILFKSKRLSFLSFFPLFNNVWPLSSLVEKLAANERRKIKYGRVILVAGN